MQETNEGCLLIFSRPATWTDGNRKYKIFVDNNVVDKIGNGQEVKLRAAAGVHVVFASIDFQRSNSIEMRFDAGHAYQFQIAPKAEGSQFWLTPLLVLIPGAWLKVDFIGVRQMETEHQAD